MDDTPGSREKKSAPEPIVGIQGLRRTLLFLVWYVIIGVGFSAIMSVFLGYSDRQFWAASLGAIVGMSLFGSLSRRKLLTPCVGFTAVLIVERDSEFLYSLTVVRMASLALMMTILFLLFDKTRAAFHRWLRSLKPTED